MLEICLVEVIAAGPACCSSSSSCSPAARTPTRATRSSTRLSWGDRGYPDRARALLEGQIEWGARCIDAHAHLGGLAFEQDDPAAAQRHYATGVAVAEASMPDGFGGVLGWGWIDNRPFLRCLHGLTLSSWRLEQHTDAEELCHALLWLNEPRRQPGSTRAAPRHHRWRTLVPQLNPVRIRRTEIAGRRRTA